VTVERSANGRSVRPERFERGRTKEGYVFDCIRLSVDTLTQWVYRVGHHLHRGTPGRPTTSGRRPSATQLVTHAPAGVTVGQVHLKRSVWLK
jgi:hypothetical protein